MFPSASSDASVLTLDIGILIGLLVMARLLDPSRSRDRLLFGITTAAFLITYALWRWNDTLPAFELSAQALWSRLFIAFESIALLYTLMSIVILVRNVDRSGQADRAQAALARERLYPAVDVFICTYDEPIEVVERAILGALALDYPNVTVWVLDDTRRDWLRDYCDRVGARHLTRPNNKGAKAGNLNNALAATARLSNAPIILVLDADFAPRADFLNRTVGLLLAEPDIAIVQTPQFYYNADPIQHNLLAAQSWVDDQRFFFDVFQPAKDAWGCAFCVGTSFIVRRDRLEEIGGFPHAAISEDLNLSYTMLRRGHRTVWLNEPLSFGLSAEGVPEYITQRTRWCLGTIQVALLRDGPLFGPGYSFTQRWHLLHGVLNWLCKPFMVLLLIAPPIYWFGSLPAFEANYLSFLRYGIPALLGLIVYMGWISRSRTLPLFMEATHAITCFAVTATLLSACIKPFGRPFKVTDKGGDRSMPRVHGKLALTFGLIAGSSAASIVWAFISPTAASEISAIDFFNLLWAAIAMLIAFTAFLVCFELPRGEDLFAVEEQGWLTWGDDIRACRVAALSLSSARLICASDNDLIHQQAGQSQARTSRLVIARSEATKKSSLPQFKESGLLRGACHRAAHRADPVARNDGGEADEAFQLHIERLGWVEASNISRSGQVIQVRLQPSVAQRQLLVVRLFSSSYGAVADRARLGAALVGLARRGFLGR